MLRISTMILYLCPMPHSPIYSSIAHCCIPTYLHSTREEEWGGGGGTNRGTEEANKQTDPTQSVSYNTKMETKERKFSAMLYLLPFSSNTYNRSFHTKTEKCPTLSVATTTPPLFPSRGVCQSRTNKSHFGSGSFVALGLIWFLCFSVDFQMWGKYARML